jgi:hypothetical protein
MRAATRLVVLGLLGSLVASCSITTSELLANKPFGTAQIYPVTLDRAWKIARAIVDTTAAYAVEERREDGKDGVLIVTTEAHDWHVATKFAIWIEPVEAGTRLIVLSRTVRPGAFPRALSEKEFHRDFAQRVVGNGLGPLGVTTGSDYNR